MIRRMHLRKVILSFAVIYIAGCGKGLLSKVSPDNPPRRTNALGLEVVDFYNHNGTYNFFDDVTTEGMTNSLAVLQSRAPGVVTSLSYTRPTVFGSGSPWLEINTTRSSSYAAALHLLRQRGIYAPVLVSVSQIQGYLKFYDDLWYASLETALDQSIPGTQRGRGSLSKQISEDLKNRQLALPSLQPIFSEHQAIWNLSASSRREYWLQNPFQFKPLGFYVGESLEKIWLSDRLLLQERTNIESKEAELFNVYYKSEASGAKMLNILRAIFAKVSNRVDPALFSNDGISALINPDRLAYTGPQSRLSAPSSPGILERLTPTERKSYDRFGIAQPGMSEIVRLVKSGKLSLKPASDEGVMIYQRYAIEPLITFGQVVEGKIVHPSIEIQSMWDDVYKAASAKIQETHQKVIDTGDGLTSAPINPERLWLEPVPTFYLRQFQAYMFLKNYAESLPADFLNSWQINGTSAVTFFNSLATQMLSLYVLSSKQIGLSYDPAVKDAIQSIGETHLFGKATQFLRDLPDSPAMSYDQRIIAVQGRPGGPKSEKCGGKPATFWATIGVEAVPVHVSSNSWREGADNHGVSIESEMVVLVDHFNEINACVAQPLSREEWREILSTSSNTDELSDKILQF